MFKIGDTLVPLDVENDGYRSCYRVVGTDGDFVDVINLNFMSNVPPERRLATEFMTEEDWDSGTQRCPAP